VLAALAMPAHGFAGQVTIASKVQGAAFPREPFGREAIGGDIRGWSSVEYDRPLAENVDFNGDVVLYASGQRRALVDGEAMVVWRGSKGTLAGGLLRERWGRFSDSPLDPLGPSNTLFSLVAAEQRLSQPTIRATASVGGASLDVYALAGFRGQPVPESDGRFGFGVRTRDVVRRGATGEQALAVRVSGTQPTLDWAVHVFGGLNRQPTFVPRFTDEARLESVDATYTQIVQAGGEMETTRAEWRFLAEGFVRHGAVDVTGQRRNYGYVAGAAEYQRFGVAGGAYNLIPRFDVMVDTRWDRADIPFASAARAGMRIATTSVHPLQVDMGYSYDWAFRGHGVLATVEKTLAESPTLTLGFRSTTFVAGAKRSVLDIWKDDLELSGYIRLELSR
jgi:hypothetical protein